MLPPDFLEHLEGGGVRPPHCMVCAHAADFERELACMGYGAFVLLCSSCSSFERREEGLPTIKREEVENKFRSGLDDLRGQSR